WVGGVAAVVVAVRDDDLPQRRDLLEAEHVVPIVVKDADGAIDLIARLIERWIARVGIDGGAEEERYPRHRLGEILPSVVAGDHAAVERAEQEIGTTRSDLSVAVEPRGSVGAGRKLEAEHDTRRHVAEETRVHPHDFGIAEVPGI